jgi:hypothetical protein
MAVIKIMLPLPARAAAWVIVEAKRRRMSPSAWLREAVLRQLYSLPGIDLSRSPYTGGTDDGTEKGQGN